VAWLVAQSTVGPTVSLCIMVLVQWEGGTAWPQGVPSWCLIQERKEGMDAVVMTQVMQCLG